jgi:Tol biopolymer transport system component
VAFDLSTRSMHEIARGSLAAWVLPGGDIAYVQANGSVFAARFDASKLELDGAPVSVLDSVRVSGQFADIAMGADGTMFYSQGAAMSGGTSLELVALSRDGGREHRVDSTWSAPITVNGGLALSPDGSQVAISVSDTTGNRDDIYVLHLPDGPATRLTFEGTSNIRPAWSPDGKTILYTSDVSSDGGKRDLWSRRADGSGRPVRVASEGRGVWEGLWSPDGKWLVYRTDDVAAGSGDILAKTTT